MLERTDIVSGTCRALAVVEIIRHLRQRHTFVDRRAPRIQMKIPTRRIHHAGVCGQIVLLHRTRAGICNLRALVAP